MDPKVNHLGVHNQGLLSKLTVISLDLTLMACFWLSLSENFFVNFLKPLLIGVHCMYK